VPATRYEILLPLKYNDGSDIESEKLLETKQELVHRFGALTVASGASQPRLRRLGRRMEGLIGWKNLS